MTALPLPNASSRYVPHNPAHRAQPRRRVPRSVLRASYSELAWLAREVVVVAHSRRPVDPRALVNEAARRVLGAAGVQELPCPADYFAYMANAARRLLSELLAEPVPGADPHAEMLTTAPALPERVDARALFAALAELEDRSPRHAQAAVLRLFGALTAAEIADQLSVTPQRAERLTASAGEWLALRLLRA